MSLSTNRSTNLKESKEKQNREKLLAGPGSEFSLANPEELELDYYDYNVTNAGAAPGSYLGMDPAYLVWIPPIDDDTKYDGSDSDEGSNANDHSEPYYEEISTDFRSPLSNSTIETPLDDVPILPPFNKNQYKSNDSNKNCHNEELYKDIVTNAFNEISPNVMLSRQISSSSILSSSCLSSGHKTPADSIQLNEIQSKALSNKHGSDGQHEVNKDCDSEKETAVVKALSCNNINDYYELDDIRFADEEDDCADGGTRTRI